jgi:hypothetical protein
VIVLVVVEATATVETVNVRLVLPAGTVTDAGTDTAALSSVRLTARPPVGAALLIVTVPVEDVPPVTLAGFRLTPINVGGGTVTVSVAVRLAPPEVAVIVLVAVAVPAVVETTNRTAEAPAGTVTEVGTVAAAVLLPVNETTAPPVGAAPLIVAVPVEEVPPVTLVGLRLTPVSVSGVTVSVAV